MSTWRTWLWGNAAMLYMLAFAQTAAPEPGPAVALAASGGLAHVHGAGGCRLLAPWLTAGGHTVMGLSMAYMLGPPLT